MEQADNETNFRDLTGLLAGALRSIHHHEDTDFPKQSDCAALLALAMKTPKAYEPCSKLANQTGLMGGLVRDLEI